MGEKIPTSTNELFAVLVLQYQMTAMIALGKLVNPVTKKAGRRLDEARHFIDMLGMLEEKTRGNLTREEGELLQRTLTELRLNYVDEARKPEPESGGAKAGSGAGPDAPASSTADAEAPAGATSDARAPASAGPGAPAREEPRPGKPGAPPPPPDTEDPTLDIGGEGSA